MWIVCQIGAREHYAIPRALHDRGELAGMLTDFWVPPVSHIGRLPGARRLRDRYHPDLAKAPVAAPNNRMLAFELRQRLLKNPSWETMISRNEIFQKWAVQQLGSIEKRLDTRSATAPHHDEPVTVFSFSYAALEIFRAAKERGWRTVLDQIDPGPEEERIVAEEQSRYPDFGSTWQPAPSDYWDSWREELALADRIIVNSDWSRQCLLKEKVPLEKIEIIPLVYGRAMQRGPGELSTATDNRQPTTDNPFKILFLGQVILRKGVGRLLDAMRLLKDEPVELILAGPSEIAESAWADQPNVRWIGPVPRSDVDRYYLAADLFILPTLSDGYALTQLEAMSHGLPVMASRNCGNAVVHGHNGWILGDLEPETIAAAIRNAMYKRLRHVRAPDFSLADLGSRLLQAPHAT